METGFDSRTQRLGDPVICTQLYFCGGSSDEQIEKIMKRGFSKEGNIVMWITSYLLQCKPQLLLNQFVLQSTYTV